jgi:Membrane bound beta barrel domain (DUF5777)
MKRASVVLAVLLGLPISAMAQSAAVAARSAANGAGGPQAPAVTDSDDDATIHPVEPDFTLVSLPTSLRLPRFGSAIRVTHRFARPLNGDFGSLASDLFGLDSGAQIGLEYRFGIAPNGQVGVHRTSDRTIELFGQFGVVRQTQSPLDISALVSVEGVNNFRDMYSPAVAVIVSRKFAERAAVYVEPTWVHLAGLGASSSKADDTVMVGLGARVRIRSTVSLVAEVSPRVTGLRPGVVHSSFGIEKRVGGHVFQLNVSDSFATTIGQIARGGAASTDWFLGFNLSRKFF